MSNQETPREEAISLITIVSVLLAIGCYVAAIQNVPIASPVLFWVATVVYHWFPALHSLPGHQIPMAVAASAVGIGFFIVAVPFSGLIAMYFSGQAVASMERATVRLRRNRARIKKRRQENDDFTAS